MSSRFTSLSIVPVTALLVIGVGVSTAPHARQPAADVAIDADDIGGVVASSSGPEAGVWVIAETRELPVRYIKSVVTDDRGRLVVPDLPPATYRVWARGYGLVEPLRASSKSSTANAMCGTVLTIAGTSQCGSNRIHSIP